MLPRLHVITDEAVLQRPDFLASAVQLLESGAYDVALHLRGRGLTGGALWDLAEPCARAASSSGAWLFVNDRLDVALACRAAGAQLGRTSFSARTARNVLGPGFTIGVSVHSAAEAQMAAADGADFLLAGTLFPTDSHPNRPATGVGWLHELATLEPPVIGIGGITPALVPAVRAAGAYGVAAISGIWRAPDAIVSMQLYLQALRREA